MGICGFRGSGKTTFATLLGYIANKKGRKILNNYYVSFGEKIDPVQFSEFSKELNNCTIILDEIWSIADNLLPNNRGARYLSYFFNQARKRDVDFIYTTQLMDVVNSRISEQSEYIYLASALKKIINKKPVLEGFEYQRYFNGYEIGQPIIAPYNKIKFLWENKMFDTKEIIYPSHILGEHGIKFDDVVKTFKECPTKKSFITLVRSDLTFISVDDISSAYDFIKINKEDKAKKILGL